MGTPRGHQRGRIWPVMPGSTSQERDSAAGEQTNKGERGSPSVTTAWRRKAPPLLLDHHNPLPGSLSPGLKPD